MGIFDPFDWNQDGKHDFQDLFLQSMIFHEINKEMSDEGYDDQNDLEWGLRF